MRWQTQGMTAMPDGEYRNPRVGSTGETGRIVVTILDESRYRYNVSIGGVFVREDIPDGPDGVNVFQPYVDGAYPVVGTWISSTVDDQTTVFIPPVVILSTTVTVDCVADVTTTAPATTAPATTALAAAAPTTTAAPATLPATGRASRTAATLAGLLTLAGGVLLVARRQPGRA